MARLDAQNHTITLATAAEYTRRHRNAGGGGGGVNATAKGGSKMEPNGGAFHADQVLRLLQQPGCTALRIYRARSADGAATVVLVGVDGNGNDMTQGVLLQEWLPCPPFCGTSNELNGG